MNKATYGLAMAAALTAVAAGLWLVATSGDDAGSHSTAQAPLSAPPTAAGKASPLRASTSAPTSFEDAARLLELGVAGDLTVDMNTRGALDILLATLGPDATPADLQKLEDSLRRSMPGEAATQAMALVRRYDAYNRAAVTETAAQQAPTTGEELHALLDKTIALRRQHFDAATARALFGAEEEQSRLDLALNAVQADPNLSATEKLARLNALREQTPRDLPGLRTPASPALVEMDQQVAALRQQGATAAQIEQVRQRHLGPEAAQALTEMESRRDGWESRYLAYAQQKKAIVAAASPDMAAQLEGALRQHFAEEELAIARAYDRNRTPSP